MSTQAHISERTTVRRERQFSNEVELAELLAALRQQRSTGVLHVHFSQGGIGSVTFEETQHVHRDSTPPTVKF